MKQTRGTAEWAYRCNAEGTSLAITRQLLDEEHFLWRNLHNSAGHKVPLVRQIEIGDTIHVYFAEDGIDRYVASYLVEQPVERADRDVPAVGAVSTGALFEKLEDAGYDKDPELGSFTGFRVKNDLYPRPLDQTPRWVARNAITRVKR